MRTETSLGTLLEQPVPNRSGTLRPCIAAVAISLVVCLAGGCRSAPPPWLDQLDLTSPERLERGYTLLLPGVMGCTSHDHDLTIGLAGANVPTAIEMHDWTAGPWMLVYNLRALDRNRREARRVAEKIMAYQDRYPGRPVHVVGYSGGAGMAVMALEELPPGRRITSGILLAATLSPDYDLRLAMSHTEQGIRNFYSPVDVPVLVGVMTVVGTMDGRHTYAAGAWGFTVPKGLDEQQRRHYEQGLIQQKYDFAMFASGNHGGHFGWVRPAFVEEWLAPLVTPPPPGSIQTASCQQNGSRAMRRAPGN
jgi:hypothetical protein